MKSKISAFLLSAFLILFIAFDAYSRAGGAGGSHSGGGGGGFSSHSSDGSSGGGAGALVWFFLLPWPIKIIIVIGVIIAAIYYLNKNKNSGGTDLESGSSGGPQGAPKPIPADFIAANPNFSEQAFIGKVNTAFLAIQEAWQNKNLGKVRKWISDGVYQRFNVQFMMMDLLEQTNFISNINIKQIRIEEATQEGNFSIITASVWFSDDDNFICKKAPEFNEKFSGDTATEYWTFIKKSGVAEKDLYHSNNCPKCGYELGNDGGQVSKCPSCGTVTYLGDYDWVLCEITQEDDYNRGGYRIEKTDPSLQPLYASDKDFSIQMMEDKASNAIMQYFASRTSHELKYVQRFTSKEQFAKLEEQIKGEGKFIYNRIYLNAVDTIACNLVNGVYWITFNVFYSSMRLQESSGKLNKIDDTVMERTISLSLARKAGAVQKTQLWSFACPSCGAPYTDTTATNCNYCQAELNSTDNDWVVVQIVEQ